VSFQIAPDVQIVEEGSPFRVVVEHGMGEAADPTTTTIVGDNGVLVQPGRSKATGPELKTISDDVSVQVGIEIRTAIVAPPTVSVKSGDVAGVLFRRLSILHDSHKSALIISTISHRVLIDPGVGTVPRPAAGLS
jgi:thiazole synthase ThiGH ThiG subunit